MKLNGSTSGVVKPLDMIMMFKEYLSIYISTKKVSYCLPHNFIFLLLIKKLLHKSNLHILDLLLNFLVN